MLYHPCSQASVLISSDALASLFSTRGQDPSRGSTCRANATTRQAMVEQRLPAGPIEPATNALALPRLGQVVLPAPQSASGLLVGRIKRRDLLRRFTAALTAPYHNAIANGSLCCRLGASQAPSRLLATNELSRPVAARVRSMFEHERVSRFDRQNVVARTVALDAGPCFEDAANTLCQIAEA